MSAVYTFHSTDQSINSALHALVLCPIAANTLMDTLIISPRHPQASSQPTFSQLLQALCQPEIELLSWSEEDMRVHPQAAVLGAPLEAGKDLYPELQGTHKQTTGHT